MNNKKRGSFFFIVGLLLTAALLLAGYNLWDNQRAETAAAQIPDVLDDEIPAPQQQASHSGPAPAGTASADIPDYIRCPDMPMPTLEIDGQDYIGILTIPGIAVELPFISEWSYPALKIAPCRYTGSAYTDTLVIAAHNYTAHFGRLNTLSIGETLSFTDVNGNIFLYQIADFEPLPPDAITQMTDSTWALTLFTCTPGGQSRVAVRCTRLAA